VRVIANVDLTDRFGPGTVDLLEVRRICNPADKNGEDPSAPASEEHLVGYRLKQRTPKFAPLKRVQIANQLGTITADLARPEYLLVPSAKSRAGTPPPLVAPTVDHFKCYRVRRARTRVPAVHVDDQFGSLDLAIKRPERLCHGVRPWLFGHVPGQEGGHPDDCSPGETCQVQSSFNNCGCE